MKKPLVTIVTVTYNLIDSGRKDYFKQCLESVHDQTYANVEHIVIDGDSKDGSVDLIKKYANKGWIKYISEKDNGIYDAMNKGIEIAKGEYIAFLNSDDYYLHNNVIVLSVENLEKEKADFSYGKCVLKYDGYDIIRGDDIEKFLYHMPFPHPTMFTKKEVLEKEGGFNEEYGAPADYELIIRMILKDYKGVYIDNELTIFRAIGVSSVDDYSKDIAKIYKNNYSIFFTFQSETQASDLKYKQKVPNKFIDKFKEYVIDREYKNIDICKVISNLRNLEKNNESKGYVIKNAYKHKVIANLATFPSRESKLKVAIKSIIDQVDVLNIYLNEYDAIPNFLKKEKINCVLGKEQKGDLKDNGKMFFLDKCEDESYYFTIDDDIIYPDDYIEKMVCVLNKYENKIVVGVHGAILYQNIKNFFLDRISYHFANELQESVFVSMLGTGTIAFYKETFRNMSLDDFKSKGMADMWFAAYCKKNNISMLCVDRKEEWLKDVDMLSAIDDTLYNAYQDDYDEQISIINEFNINQIDERNLYKYIILLEERCTNYRVNLKEKSEYIDNHINKIQNSKSFRLGNLFFRSIKKPYKLITYPYNFIKILLEK